MPWSGPIRTTHATSPRKYRAVLAKRAEDMIVDRPEANGQLFNAFFENPDFRDALLRYVAESYDEIRDEQVS